MGKRAPVSSIKFEFSLQKVILSTFSPKFLLIFSGLSAKVSTMEILPDLLY